ncbi:MAG: anthranilate phosphoribosyltransferase [Gammaproteobacteria bacterium]|nr:anthranilate phosphoribosyltransferase [Gammaproteobacteria bacterium]
MDMQSAVARVMAAEDLTRDEMQSVMRTIMTGGATDAQIGGFLVALRLKGESVAEIAAAATVMRELAARVEVDTTGLVDTCGTGGSGSNKFNVSTASAFVAAAAGARVAKHGNRGATSISGSADVLEAAGARLDLTPEQVGRCIESAGVGFLFALNHHGAMKHAIGPRRELGVRTVFNLLGPLTNPAGAERQLLGVFGREWVRPIAEVLASLGSKHVMVVHSEDGLDELSVSAPTPVAELKDGKITEYTVEPDQFGMQLTDLDSLRIGSSEESLTLVKAALSGEHQGATDIVALNAGAAIYVSGQALSLANGVEMARDAIAAGLATERLNEFCAFTRAT